MIRVDEHGNRFIAMADGSVIPIPTVQVVVRAETVCNGLIVSVADAVAVQQASAEHWYMRFQEAQTTIADLREQLGKKG